MNSSLSRSVLRLARLAVLAAAALAVPAMAQTLAETRAALEKAMPGLPASAKIIKTPYAGLYEVDIGTKLFYTDAKATFLFAGEIFDTKTQTNVTKARIDELRRVNWKDLPFKDSFQLVFGNGKRQIAIFEDPYCPYCHKMEATLEKVSNVTLHVFVVPIIRRESMQQARDIWCAPNRSKAWLDWMNHEVQPPKAAATCVDPLKSNVQLAESLGISSTPTLIFMDGSRMEGALPQEEVEKKLAAVK